MTSGRDQTPDPERLLRHGASRRALAGAILGDPHAAEEVVRETPPAIGHFEAGHARGKVSITV